MSKHVKSAKKWLNDAPVEYRKGNNQRASLCVGIAQVEATLALAEQQRIANLIALAESGRTTVNGARQALGALYDGSIEDGTAHMLLRSEIAQALGVES